MLVVITQWVSVKDRGSEAASVCFDDEEAIADEVNEVRGPNSNKVRH